MLESKDWLVMRVLKLAVGTLTLVNFMLCITIMHYFVWLLIRLIGSFV